tara:strand:- start:162 stop:341 length:180 start_codon:yes stop_codon:yes gene_type:complete
MKYDYSIDEILNAVSELQNRKKKVVSQINVKEEVKNTSKIPKDTLKIIEEAEKRFFLKN